MTNIQTVKNAYQSFEATEIDLICYEYNSSDALTKNKAHSIVTKIRINGKLDHPIQRWIICSNHGKISVEEKKGRREECQSQWTLNTYQLRPE